MRIAFDCNGTLLDPYSGARELLEIMYCKGHDIVIWSNAAGYLQEARELFPADWDIKIELKYSKHDYYPEFWEDNPEAMFDYAVDDDPEQTYLAAKKLVDIRNVKQILEMIDEET